MNQRRGRPLSLWAVLVQAHVAGCLLFLAWAPALGATPQVVDEIWEDELRRLPTEEIDRVLRNLDADVRSHLPPFDLGGVLRDPEGGWHLDLGYLVRSVAGRLVGELLTSARLLWQLVIIALLASLVRGLAPEKGGARELTVAVALLAVSLLALESFRTAAAAAGAAVSDMVSFLYAVTPLLVTLTASAGAVTSAALFHPVLLGVVTLAATVVHRFALPLAFGAVVLGVAGCLGSNLSLGRLTGLFRHWTLTALGLIFVGFMGVLSVRGAVAPVADGLALRTARFLTGTFIPVVGGRIADALDVVVGGSLLIRNAAGAFAMLTIFLVTVFPALKILALLFVYRLAAGLVEPLTDSPVSEALGVIGDGLAFLMACLVTVALMFFMGLTMLVGAGNLTAVMR